MTPSKGDTMDKPSGQRIMRWVDGQAGIETLTDADLVEIAKKPHTLNDYTRLAVVLSEIGRRITG